MQWYVYGDVKFRIVLLFVCLKCVLYEGNYAAETFPIETCFFSWESNELHLLTVILKMFCVCFGLDIFFFFLGVTQSRVYGRVTLALN